jgi:hypothetical protein
MLNFKKFIIPVAIIILLVVLFSSNICLAGWESELKDAGENTGLIGGGSTTAEAQNQVNSLTVRIVQFFLGAVGLTLLIMLIYGGFLWMMARGDEAKVTKAKDLIENAVIGLIIVLAAYGISYFVLSQLGSITGGAPAS